MDYYIIDVHSFPYVPFILDLVGGFWNMIFFHILEIMIQTDFHIFQTGRSTTRPPTRDEL